MVQSTSESPPQGLNWAQSDPDSDTSSTEQGAASARKNTSSDAVKGLFDKNKRTSLTPLPVGENISFPPLPEDQKHLEQNAIKQGRSKGVSPSEYKPPPVAAFGEKNAAHADREEALDSKSGQSTRGLFSMDTRKDQDEKGQLDVVDKAKPKAVKPRYTDKKTVMGVGPVVPASRHKTPLVNPPTQTDKGDNFTFKEPRSSDLIEPMVRKPTTDKLTDGLAEEKVSKLAEEPVSEPVKEKVNILAEESENELAIEEVSEKTDQQTVATSDQGIADTIFANVSLVPTEPTPISIENSLDQVQQKGGSVSSDSYSQDILETETPQILQRSRKKRFRIALASAFGILTCAVLLSAYIIGRNLFSPKSQIAPAVDHRSDKSEQLSKKQQIQPQKPSSQEELLEEKVASQDLGLNTQPPPETIPPPQEPVTKQPSPDQIVQAEEKSDLKPEVESKDEPSETTSNLPVHLENESVSNLLRQGKRLLLKGNWVQAEALYRAVLIKDPDEHHAKEGLVKIFLKRHAPSEALKFAEDIVKKRSRRATYRILLGDVLAQMGNKKGAKEQYEEAMRLSPNHRTATKRLKQME